MDPKQLGRIKRLIGISREKMSAEEQAGADALAAERQEARAKIEEQNARYMALLAEGKTDAEIETIMREEGLI